jgi:hypothetical protein
MSVSVQSKGAAAMLKCSVVCLLTVFPNVSKGKAFAGFSDDQQSKPNFFVGLDFTVFDRRGRLLFAN